MFFFPDSFNGLTTHTQIHTTALPLGIKHYKISLKCNKKIFTLCSPSCGLLRCLAAFFCEYSKLAVLQKSGILYLKETEFWVSFAWGFPFKER